MNILGIHLCVHLLFFFSIKFLVNEILGQKIKQFLTFFTPIAKLSCFSNFVLLPAPNKNASLEILIRIELNLK